MGRPCKVCSSSITSEIDKQILDDVSFANIEKFSVGRGLRVSAKSIGEHARNHVTDYQARSEKGFNYNPSDTPRNQTASETVLNPTLIKRIPFKGNERLIETAKRSLCEILLNQLTIVNTKQQLFMKGESGYPNDEMRGLKTVLECFQVITNKKAGQHIFDVDTALETTETIDLNDLLENLS